MDYFISSPVPAREKKMNRFAVTQNIQHRSPLAGRQSVWWDYKYMTKNRSAYRGMKFRLKVKIFRKSTEYNAI
jgi:hypothetical protein